MTPGKASWVVGQRVIAQTEPELGMGEVTQVEFRAIEVTFRESGVVRRYASHLPPLQRLRLRVGQTASTLKGQTFTVAASREERGLIRYTGAGLSVFENELSFKIPDQDAVERFLAGPWSAPRAYDLRRMGWKLLSRSLDPEVRGLVGARISLLPHQLHIAHRVSRREWPRVLLSDEVGLGKTIEAGLIFSSLQSLGRATRVLVLAPTALKHQWLSELYRRFNELFSIVDGGREEADIDFVSNQRVISSTDFLLSDARWLEMALEEPWDLLIVDEAHHLNWGPGAEGGAWKAVRALAERSRGLLLLTATPRQQGFETQFGLLHLVDPARFADFEEFKLEAAKLRETAGLARKITEGQRDSETLGEVRRRFRDDGDVRRAVDEFEATGVSERLLNALIDRHGTGRVLMRNRRERLQGFPRRKLYPVPLSADEPEARARWLVSFLNALAPHEKVLLLCSTPTQVKRLDATLRSLTGLKRTLFHEGMDIVERDRQAAWFAEPGGAQLLISSEIGGEGRNFQFASKLVLYDLPSHPDLLEQRIGRLDRIGQRRDVEIYVPWVRETPDEVYFTWYAEGVRSFDRAWSGGASLLREVEGSLLECVKLFAVPKAAETALRRSKLAALIERTQAAVGRIEILNRESVDTLVDLNSFDPAHGEALRSRIHATDEDRSVRDYMEAVFDHYGVEAEDFDSQGTLKLSAHSLTFIESFPDLPAGSETLVTFERAVALAREDLKFLSQDHPMVKGALSLLLDRGEGRASIGALVPSENLASAKKTVQFLFVLQANAVPALEVERYLPLTVIEIFSEDWGEVRAADSRANSETPLDAAWTALPEETRARLAHECRTRLGACFDRATALAENRAQSILREALDKSREHLHAEQARLVQLARVNASVRENEIKEHAAKISSILEAIVQAAPRLDAIRLIVS